MADGKSNRGVSEVMGAIIIFAFLVVAWATYQGLVVPQQEKGVEFEHNEEVQGDLLLLRDSILQVSVTATDESISLRLGADYQERLFAVTLANSAGSLQTRGVGDGTIGIGNATALDTETADYWDGSIRTFDSQSLQYRPVYTRYSDAPTTVYENTVLYNRFEQAGENITMTEQAIVDGRQITLIAVGGSFAESRQGSVSVNIDPKSASSTKVSVTNTTGARLAITIPTELSAAIWNESLASERVGNGGHVDVRDTGTNQVSIILESGVTYDLRMAKLELGAGATDEGATYLTSVRRPDSSVFNDTSHEIVVEVRDRFNNPVSGVEVNASAASGTFEETQVTSDADGHAAFNYTAPNAPGTDTISFDSSSTPTARERVQFTLTVKKFFPGRTQINRGTPHNITIDGVSAPYGPDINKVNVSFENLNPNDWDVVAARFVGFYDGNVSCPCPEFVRFNDAMPRLKEGGPMRNLSSPVTLAAGSVTDVPLNFRRNPPTGAKVTELDAVFLEVKFEKPNGDPVIVSYYFQLGGYN